MKKVLFIICLALLLTSAKCEHSNIENRTDAYDIYVDTVRGHEYIIMRAMYSGNIIHSESCPCKKGGEL